MLRDKLEAMLGKNIGQICANNFHDNGANHCAHFVSHALDLRFPYNCKQFQGGSHHGANIRVHEVFPHCPKVGKRADMDTDRDQLVFITLASNVDLVNKKMVNIPQKHIGIYCEGEVYHYSNGGDKVIKESLDSFEAKFQAAYTGVQGLFFGHFPAEGTTLNVVVSGQNVSSDVAFSLRREGRRWFAQRVDSTEDSFLVGKEIFDNSNNYFGLFVPGAEYYGPKYKGDDYVDRFGHYAYLLELSGYCESKNRFNLINTYDRAKFTWGFYQLAAHTPNDNLILLMRQLVSSGLTARYFKELAIVNGRVHRVDVDGSKTDLEQVFPTGPNGDDQLQLFMNYLNPNRNLLDDQEVLQAARVMHMANNSSAVRNTQVEVSAKILERKMAVYGARYGLDRKTDVICAIIADIHHQGRARSQKVKDALASSNPEKNLIDINANYATRAADLRTVIGALRDSGKLGTKKYDASSNTFE